MLNGRYLDLFHALRPVIPEDRLYHDDLRTLAYGTDASFYRLIPKLVVKVESEEEVSHLLACASRLELPVTFRAAGTSLSGQSVSDSVLALLGTSWTRSVIHGNGETISLQPGLVGAFANVRLASYGRKIGPDPASINSAMIGGIIANNASGMCCGTAQNSYRTLESMKIIFVDGSVLDTADASSKEQFARTHGKLLETVSALAARVKANTPLADRIVRKYKMKNTTGYSLNALVEFTDPIEIIQHLMVGSEGTLGFIAEVTLRTVPELHHKATSLMLFHDIKTACEAVALLKSSAPVDAVELMDRASLRSVELKSGMPPFLKELGPAVASLLVETRATDDAQLDKNIETISTILKNIPTVRPLEFTTDVREFSMLWNIRKGLFPSVGAMRKTGTTVIIEDVAFPLPRLAEAALDLQHLFETHGYHDAIIFGHSLEGNLHFVFKQDFNNASEVERYQGFMDDVTSLVVRKYDGSLKAEHGTGRNMAPFVELEWGTEAHKLMGEIKSAFDSGNILNPGVILNPDPRAHLRNLKPLPAADETVDKCIECGFCEIQCPSRNLTLTPRQRIVVVREMARLRETRESPARLRSLQKDFQYYGDDTCATDGLCALSCPVSINTGDLIKHLRHRNTGVFQQALASLTARHMKEVTWIMRFGLNKLQVFRTLFGTWILRSGSAILRSLTGGTAPMWNDQMPRGAQRIHVRQDGRDQKTAVVYFPTCINRTIGTSPGTGDPRSLVTVTLQLLQKAGLEVRIPEHVDGLCCGMAFASKGFAEQGMKKAEELEAALVKASENGRLPILVDMSPCLGRTKETFRTKLPVYDQSQFTLQVLKERLRFAKLQEPVMLHPTCSTIRMGISQDLRDAASLCSDTVIVPEGIGCCGWAGDRGFTVPELNASALASLKEAIPHNCSRGYSNSRTCEIGLSLHGGIPYQSILYLVDQCTTALDRTP